MKSTGLFLVLCSLLCCACAQADPAPAPTATPPVLSLEEDGSTSVLSNNRGTWNDETIQALLTGPVSAYANASNEERFGFDDHWYEAGVYIPTGMKRGTLSFTGGFSPEHHVLPATQYTIGYDLRGGGGYGLQVGYTARTYPGINVEGGTVGFDHYYGNQRLAFAVNGAVLSNVPGLALSYNGRWSIYALHDTLSISAFTGRDVENTGTAIAVYNETGAYVDELHWLSGNFAVHGAAGIDNLAGAYGRFEVSLGLRERL